MLYYIYMNISFAATAFEYIINAAARPCYTRARSLPELSRKISKKLKYHIRHFLYHFAFDMTLAFLFKYRVSALYALQYATVNFRRRFRYNHAKPQTETALKNKANDRPEYFGK